MGNITNYRTITFFDTETTSLDPTKGEIIQVAILTEDGNGNLEEWSTKIKPKLLPGTFEKSALEINGYNEDDWWDAPTIEEVAAEIVQRLCWGPLVAHNANFDIRFLENVLTRDAGWKPCSTSSIDRKTFRFGYPVIDTVALAYLMIPTERQSLMTLREHFDIPKEGGHEAVKDCHDTRRVFWHCVNGCIDFMFSDSSLRR